MKAFYIGGSPCSGKSTIAELIFKSMALTILSLMINYFLIWKKRLKTISLDAKHISV